MRIPEHPTLIRRMLQPPQKAGHVHADPGRLILYLHASLRPLRCRCHHGGPLHPGQHLTFKENGKTRSVYVPKELLPEVRSWIAEHRRLKELLKEIHQLTLALLRARARP